MPLTHGRMAMDQEMKIRSNMQTLNENMDARDLVDYFIQEEIFDFPDLEEINGYSPNTTANRNACFFKLLFDSGPRAFDVFLEALQNQHQDFLVDVILQTNMDYTDQANPDPAVWIHNIPNRRLTLQDKDLARLCNTLGMNWEVAMYTLGLRENEVWRCKEDNKNSVLMQIYAGLTMWKRKNLNNATLETFVNALRSCDGVGIDWEEDYTRMPLTPGAMPARQKSKITKNFRYLKENIDAKDLLDVFVEKEIFDFADLDKINGYNPNTMENRNNAFFQLLFNSGPSAYNVFLEALGQNNREDLADKIDATEVPQGQIQEANADCTAWFEAIPSHIKKQRLKERELSKLAQTLGSDWEMVALDMGLSQTDIDHAKMDQMTTTMKIYACLNKWRVRTAGDATFASIISVLRNCQATTIDWQQVEKIVKDYAG